MDRLAAGDRMKSMQRVTAQHGPLRYHTCTERGFRERWLQRSDASMGGPHIGHCWSLVGVHFYGFAVKGAKLYATAYTYNGTGYQWVTTELGSNPM